MRPAIFLALALVLPDSPAIRAGETPATATILWPGQVESHGACVEKPTWFVSVVPGSVDVDAIEAVTLRLGEFESEARLLHLDPRQRLCLLEVEDSRTGALPLPLFTSPSPRAGSRAECLLDESTCRTTVAGKDWSYQGERFPRPLLRLRISETAGDCESGTPMVNPDGALIGLLTCFKLKPTGEIYAIPATRIAKIVEDVKNHRRSGPVWVGLVFHDESSTPEILKVRAGSPAETAGLRAGDVVLAMNGIEIETFDEVDEMIQNLPAGKPASIRVLRGLEETDLSMVPQFAEPTAASR